MLAKVIATGADRAQAIARLRAALDAFAIEGVKTNLPFIQRVLDDDDFVAGRIDTGLAQRVLAGGTKSAAAAQAAASTLTS